MNAAVLTRDAPARPEPKAVRLAGASVDDEWIALAADLPRGAVRSPWHALLRNAELAGPAKLVLPSGVREIEIRVELPLDEGVDVAARLREAQAAVTQALGCPPSALNDASSGRFEPGAIDLAAVAEDAGWRFVSRASGRIAVDLDVPDQFCQAIVEPLGAGCRARVVLAVISSPSELVRSALAVLLLAVTASVRMVRAGAIERQGETTMFVEADIAAGASARELHHALAALGVACRMASREAKALADDRVAGLYLAARGWAARS